MVFSLQRRFLLFLLLPVVVIMSLTGFASFMYARSYLLDQWRSSAMLRLEKTAHQIRMKLDEKRRLMDLIAEADGIPGGPRTQSFLLAQLRKEQGVFSVEIGPIAEVNDGGTTKERPVVIGGGPEKPDSTATESPQSAEACPGPGMMRGMGMGQGMMRGMMRRSIRPIWTHPDQSVSFLLMTRELGGEEGLPAKLLTVKVGFDSFMEHILSVGRWQKSYACLVTSDGTYLAHTDRSMVGMKNLGAHGDALAKKVLAEMQKKSSGTIFGEGHPPRMVAGFYKIPTTDWYLVLFSKGSTVLGPIIRFRFNYALAGMAALLIIALLIRASTKPVAQAVTEITAAAARVEQGDYTAKVIENRSDEIGSLKRSFNRMTDGLKERELIERTFGRYVDKSVAEELMTRPGALTLGGEIRTVTILMSDLRGFTVMSEKLKPEQVIRILNMHFSGMISVIERYRGIIVDFYGDSILAFFDGMASDTEARAADAVKCAVDMQRELMGMSEHDGENERPPLHMGIGIHTGEVVVGNIGSETRAKYGIVGSAVNETDRIQSFADRGSIVISGATYELLSKRLVVGPRRQVNLKGLEGDRDLFEVVEIDGKSHMDRPAKPGTA